MNTAIFGSGGEEGSAYRYLLERDLPVCWSPNSTNVALFLMLNPSTAGATVNDPTIRRCVGFCSAWGYGRLLIANKYAMRSPDPKAIPLAMCSSLDVVGPDNDQHLLDAARRAHLIVCAWGNLQGRWDELRTAAVLELLKPFDLHALQLNADGQPAHPLYLKKSLTPVLWKAASP